MRILRLAALGLALTFANSAWAQSPGPQPETSKTSTDAPVLSRKTPVIDTSTVPREPPFGSEDIAYLDRELAEALVFLEDAINGWNHLAVDRFGTAEHLEAGQTLGQAEEIVQRLRDELAKARTAPPRELVKARLAYDAEVAKMTELYEKLLPPGEGHPTGATTAAILEAEAELANIAQAGKSLARGADKPKFIIERLSDLEKLDEEIRAEEELLAFEQSIHDHLGDTVFLTYLIYEAEVEQLLATIQRMESLWDTIRRNREARRYGEDALSPRQIAEKWVQVGPGDGLPGIETLWRARAGISETSEPPSVLRHAGNLAKYQHEIQQHRFVRDRLQDEAERLRTLAAEDSLKAAAEEPTTPGPTAAPTGEYARLGALIKQNELRIETLKGESLKLTDQLAKIDEDLGQRKQEQELAESQLRDQTNQLENRKGLIALKFPRSGRSPASHPARIQNFVAEQRLLSEQSKVEAIGQAIRRVEISRDVLKRRRDSIEAELARVKLRELPRLRSEYYQTVGETVGTRGLKILVVLGFAFLALRFIKRGTSKIIERVVESTLKRQGVEAIRQQRTRTLISVFAGAARFVIYVLAMLFVAGQLDIDYGPLLVAAGGISLAIGFGAQTLVRDFFAGFFILLEGQYSIGDIVDIEGKSGTVEDLNLRTTVLRSLNGEVHTIPNGEIKMTTNKTKQWSRAVVDVAVAYEEDVDQVIAVLLRIAQEFKEHEHWSTRLRAVDVLGVEGLGDSSVLIRVLIETVPGQQWAASREFHRRVKLAFDNLGIEIPWPQRVITEKTADRSDQAALSKRRAIRRYVGVPVDDAAPTPSVEERDRAEVIAQKEAEIRAEEEKRDSEKDKEASEDDGKVSDGPEDSEEPRAKAAEPSDATTSRPAHTEVDRKERV